MSQLELWWCLLGCVENTGEESWCSTKGTTIVVLMLSSRLLIGWLEFPPICLAVF